jgi:hypothetical protein
MSVFRPVANERTKVEGEANEPVYGDRGYWNGGLRNQRRTHRFSMSSNTAPPSEDSTLAYSAYPTP